MTNELEQVLYDGYFSEYLPPVFSLRNDKFRLDLYPPSEDCDVIEPLSYTMSRFTKNNDRRCIYIPEIGSFLSCMQYLKNSNILQEMVEYANKSTHSFSHVFEDDGSLFRHEQSYDFDSTTSFSSSNFVPNMIKKIKAARGAKGILHLDISNCYGSFYTHLIPSIIMGKQDAELQYRASILQNPGFVFSETYLKYRKFDDLTRRQNGNRTNGVLTGPIISKVIIESMLCRIDSEIEAAGINFSRYIDDYEVYIMHESEIPKIQEKISGILGNYYFYLNNEKTKYEPFPYYIVQDLEKIALSFMDRNDEESVVELFNKFYCLETEGVKGALNFLLRTMDKTDNTFPADITNSYLITILNNDSRSLTKACALLIENHNITALNENDAKAIAALYGQALFNHHDIEAIWLFYLLYKIGRADILVQSINDLVDSNNELLIIMAIHILNDNIRDDQRNTIINNARSWMLLYELYVLNLIDEESFMSRTLVSKNSRFYKRLKDYSFSFFHMH